MPLKAQVTNFLSKAEDYDRNSVPCDLTVRKVIERGGDFKQEKDGISFVVEQINNSLTASDIKAC